MSFDFKSMLKKEFNLGEKDITIRRNIGIVSVMLSVLPGSVPMLIIGIFLLGSAAVGWCPVYSGLHKNTSIS